MTEEIDATKQWEEAGGIKLHLECGGTLADIEKSMVVIGFNDTPAGKVMSRIWGAMSLEERNATGLADIQLRKTRVVILPLGVTLAVILPDGTVKGVLGGDIKQYTRESVRECLAEAGETLRA